ncbi:MAG TPA: hypothetical protein VKC62_09300 [Gaiellaceae bacterium]|nr:hypothetical protein [Gaiellaceae bacterium]
MTILNVDPGVNRPSVVRFSSAEPPPPGPTDLEHLPVAVRLEDEVLVVRRRGRHHLDRSRARIHGDDRAAAVAEQLLRQRLRLRVDREDDVVAVHRRAAEAVQRALDRVAEVRVRPREEGVQGLLESGLRVRRRRVADRLRGEPALRVAPEEERLPVPLHRAIGGEHRLAVGRDDQPARHLELRDELDRVVLPRGEASRRPRLPVRRGDDEGDQEPDGDEREADELPVHRLPTVFARLDTSISPATTRKFATTDDPP